MSEETKEMIKELRTVIEERIIKLKDLSKEELIKELSEELRSKADTIEDFSNITRDMKEVMK
jgi:hypothetical protein